MKVLLCEDVQKCGLAGEVKDVSDGFARNFLLPKKLAMAATDASLRRWESEKKVRLLKIEKNLEAARKVAEQLEALEIQIPAKAGKEGHLFGSINNHNVADALVAKGFAIDRKNISVESPIKSLGEFTVLVKLHAQVNANLKVRVVAAAQ